MTLTEIAEKLERLFDVRPEHRSAELRALILEIEIAARRERELATR